MSKVQLGFSPEDLLSVMEAAFRGGLQEIRKIRASHEPAGVSKRPRVGRKDAPSSRTLNAIDILTETRRPLHIQEILEALESRGLQSSRESLVSALTKRLAPAGPLVRTAPNTFALKGRAR